MRRLLYLITAVLVLLVGASFVLKNQDSVTVQYYLGLDWSGPLSLLLLFTFSLGVVAGYLAALGKIARAKKETAATRKEISEVEEEVASLRRLPIKDVI